MTSSGLISEATPLLRVVKDVKRPLPDKLSEVPLDSWLMLSGVWIGVFLAALDSTMVATLQTTIASEFNKNNLSSWLGSSYLLSVAAFQGLYGRVSDIVGRRNACIFSVTTFTLGTILCGMASSMELIIAGRAIAGIGGGGLTTLSSIVCSDLVSLRQRGTFQGLANCLFGAGAALGGPLGGLLTQHFGFRFAFLCQVPFCLLSLAIILWKVDIELPFAETSARQKLKQIDFLGAITLVIAITLLVGASTVGGNLMPWSSPQVIGSFIAFGVFLMAFTYIELRIATSPVLPFDIVTRRTPGCAAIVNFFGAAASFGFLYTVPIYFQGIQQLRPQTAGLHLLPNAAGIPIGSLIAGAFMARYGRYYKLTLLFTLCFPISALSLSTWGKQPAAWRTYFDIAFNGLGTAGATTTTLIALLSAVQQHELAVATGLSYLARSVGQVLGVTLSQAILQDVLSSQLAKRIHDPAMVEAIRKDATLVRGLPKGLMHAAIESYNVALRCAFLSISAMGLCAFFFALFIQERTVAKADAPGDTAEVDPGDQD